MEIPSNGELRRGSTHGVVTDAYFRLYLCSTVTTASECIGARENGISQAR